ncbi:histidine kinase N-terminal 7TM domain-containing protein [Halobaculum lipolyticum]|uniref:histidine kinase n=1 Tax=Halobaculum lipolyticum TaxID=3032001 RepID=A0ABD5WC05_9EURY|nr:histidine kinase N-terminal 7TM domain-containing protein [Halobaculum sp. DT31]
MSTATYVGPLLWVAGATSLLVLAAVLWRRRVSLGGPEVVGFVGLATGATLWTWAYALELGATTLPAIAAYHHLVWIGTGIVGASWPVFALAVAGDDRWLTRFRLPLISGPPLGFALLGVSNAAHRLIYRDVSLVSGDVARVTVTPGVGLVAFLVWSFAVNSYVLWRLLRSRRGTTGAARTRRLAVFVAGVLPMLAGVVSIALATGDGPTIDFTPATFSVTTVITGVAITRYRLLDSIAVAQDHVVGRLSDPVVIVDGDGTVRATNGAARRLFGTDDPTGRSVERVFERRPELLEAIRGAPRDGRTEVTVTVERTADRGATTTAEGRAGAVADGVGGTDAPRTFTAAVEPIAGTGAVVLVFRDITERRAAEERAEVFNRMLRHDLRNDIAVIDGYLGLLRQELGDDAEGVADVMDVLTTRTDGMLAVTEQAALADSVVDAAPDVRRFDVASVVRRRCEQVAAEHPRVRLETTLPDDEVPITAASAFPSVVDNLIENAIEHAAADRPHLVVSVDVAPDGSTVDLRIADDGPGLSPAERAVLVGEDRTLDRVTGLGLWLINRITQLSGGTIAADVPDGGGTVVTLSFPVAGASPPAATASPS